MDANWRSVLLLEGAFEGDQGRYQGSVFGHNALTALIGLLMILAGSMIAGWPVRRPSAFFPIIITIAVVASAAKIIIFQRWIGRLCKAAGDRHTRGEIGSIIGRSRFPILFDLDEQRESDPELWSELKSILRWNLIADTILLLSIFAGVLLALVIVRLP